MAGIEVKICGLKTPEMVEAALEAGADMVGLVFHRASPRHVATDVAATLSAMAKGRACVVALLVEPDEGTLETILRLVNPDMLQLHGRETPAQVADIRGFVARPVMKALGIAGPADLVPIPEYWSVADRLLLDAKPPKDSAYPGGHGATFDWSLLDALDPPLPFMLSGGLTPANVAQAIARVRHGGPGAGGARLTGVDVSSGVESAPGVKDADLIRRFIEAARAAANE